MHHNNTIHRLELRHIYRRLWLYYELSYDT